MNKKYYDLINYSSIKSSVDFWNGPLAVDLSHEFKGKNVFQAIEYWKSRALKTDKIESSLVVYLENHDLLYSDYEIKFITELLNHPERTRFRLIHDGSYYSHRVWFHVNPDDKKIHISPSIAWYDGDESLKPLSDEMNILPVEDKIQFLLDHFEVVYIHMDIVENRSDIIDNISNDIHMYRMLDFDL